VVIGCGLKCFTFRLRKNRSEHCVTIGTIMEATANKLSVRKPGIRIEQNTVIWRSDPIRVLLKDSVNPTQLVCVGMCPQALVLD